MAGRRDIGEERPRNIVKRVFVIYEGRETEKGYFDCFRNSFKLSNVFSYEKAPKERYDLDNTWRTQMKDLLYGFVQLCTRGRYTPFYFSKIILDEIFDENGLDPDTMGRVLRDAFYKVRKDSANEISKQSRSIVSGDLIRKDRLGEAASVVLDTAKGLLQQHHLRGIIPSDSIYKGDNVEDYDPARDRIFMVIDRDFDYTKDSTMGERTDESYDAILEDCENKGIDVLLSNPDFEFWMLLHHDLIDGREIDYWDTGTGVGARDRVERALLSIETLTKRVEVRDKNGRKKTRLTKVIDHDRFVRYYQNRFDFAIANSQSSELTLELKGPNGLVRNAGSNVGIKLKELMND